MGDSNKIHPGKYPDEVSVETDKEESLKKPSAVVLDVSIPGDAGVEAIVKQDMDGSGEADNTEAVEAKPGKHRYQLSEFEEGGHYLWTEFKLKSGGQNQASISSFQLKVES